MPEQQGQGLHGIGSVSKVTNHPRDGAVLSERTAQDLANDTTETVGSRLGDESPTPDLVGRVSSHGSDR